eukprot:3950212-Amphidinium_carterae.1
MLVIAGTVLLCCVQQGQRAVPAATRSVLRSFGLKAAQSIGQVFPMGLREASTAVTEITRSKL